MRIASMAEIFGESTIARVTFSFVPFRKWLRSQGFAKSTSEGHGLVSAWFASFGGELVGTRRGKSDWLPVDHSHGLWKGKRVICFLSRGLAELILGYLVWRVNAERASSDSFGA